ncbi:MAG: HAD family hydrolase [Nitrospinaceae bacterium]
MGSAKQNLFVPNFQAIFFDYGGTLDADGIPWKEHHQSIYESLGIRLAQKKFDQAFYAADDSLTDEGLNGFSLKETLHEQVRRVFQGLGIGGISFREKVVDIFIQDTVHKVEENKGVLEQLKTRYRMGIISNFYGNLETICEELGLSPFLDVIVDSRRVGVTKPHAGIFNHALKAVGCSPARSLMVGDSARRDMLGARAIGMPHVLLMDPGNPGAPQTCCPGDRVIGKLADLLEVV